MGQVTEPAEVGAPAAGEIERVVTEFLAAVDSGDRARLESCFDPEATMYFPFENTPDLVEGRAAILERFDRLFAAWRRRGLSTPYVGFAPKQFRTRVAGTGHALATFTVGIEGAPGRRSVLLRRSPAGWQILHLHASNLSLRAGGGGPK